MKTKGPNRTSKRARRNAGEAWRGGIAPRASWNAAERKQKRTRKRSTIRARHSPPLLFASGRRAPPQLVVSAPCSTSAFFFVPPLPAPRPFPPPLSSSACSPTVSAPPRSAHQLSRFERSKIKGPRCALFGPLEAALRTARLALAGPPRRGAAPLGAQRARGRAERGGPAQNASARPTLAEARPAARSLRDRPRSGPSERRGKPQRATSGNGRGGRGRRGGRARARQRRAVERWGREAQTKGAASRGRAERAAWTERAERRARGEGERGLVGAGRA